MTMPAYLGQFMGRNDSGKNSRGPIKLKPIKDQVAVVFGASSGIGRQTAIDLARRGAKVVAGARSEPGLVSLIEEIENDGGDAFYVVADAADFEQVNAVAEKAFGRHGRIDSWIHTAGVAVFARFEECTPEEFRQVVEVNLLGQVHGAMAALPFIKRSGGGALIHVSSVEAYRSLPFQAAYGASKHGVKGFLQALRLELQREGIPVVVTEIMPSAINTPIWDKGRNKFDHKVRPPMWPIYAPNVVADAILYAAENPVREMVAGGTGVGVPLAERISPRFGDAMTRLVGFYQFENEAESPERPDSLFGPVPHFDTVEGRFSDKQITRDPYAWIRTHPKTAFTLAAAAGGALVALLLQSPNRKKTAASFTS
jgi:NAD(P)-dependent dehydrogenase (short-subunit alcohol dehydrogenase family)